MFVVLAKKYSFVQHNTWTSVTSFRVTSSPRTSVITNCRAKRLNTPFRHPLPLQSAHRPSSLRTALSRPLLFLPVVVRRSFCFLFFEPHHLSPLHSASYTLEKLYTYIHIKSPQCHQPLLSQRWNVSTLRLSFSPPLRPHTIGTTPDNKLHHLSHLPPLAFPPLPPTKSTKLTPFTSRPLPRKVRSPSLRHLARRMAHIWWSRRG